jgi:hypothetical protein
MLPAPDMYAETQQLDLPEGCGREPQNPGPQQISYSWVRLLFGSGVKPAVQLRMEPFRAPNVTQDLGLVRLRRFQVGTKSTLTAS